MSPSTSASSSPASATVPSVDALLAQASFLSARGRHAAAERVVTTALSFLTPAHVQYAPALVQLAAVHVAHSRPADAEDSLRSALRAAPDFVPALQALATILSNNPVHLPEALHLLRRAFNVSSPTHDASLPTQLAALLTDVGVRLKMAGLPADALKHYSEALDVCPTYAQAMYNMAVAHADTSRTKKARMYYDQCLKHNASHVEAWCNLGVLHRNDGNADLAMCAYEKALSCNPNYELAKSNLAVALCEKGTAIKHSEPKLAKKLYKRALALQPCFSDAHYNLGVLYAETGKLERALLSYNLAVQFNPRLTEAHNNLGVVHKELGNMHQALECYKRALQCDRRHHQTHNNIAVVYTLLGDIDSATEHLRTANSISPRYAEAYNNIGVLLRDQGEIDLAITHYERCSDIDPRADMAAQNRLHALNYSEHWSKAQVHEQHHAWGTAFQKRIDGEIIQAANGSHTDNPIALHLLRCLENPPRPHPSRPRGPGTDCPFRIGYISPDFFTHSVSYFAQVLLQKYDPTGFEVYAYANVAQPDAKTIRFQKLLKDRWRNIWSLTASAAAKLIVDDKIDILVELAGHTANNRLDIMALRLAPIQVTWIGYPNTTGLSTIHYRVTDGAVDPHNTSQQFSEKLWRLPDVFLCYTPALEAPQEPSDPPSETSGGIITFGSFNVLAKVQSRTIRLWASILKRVPNSRLLLKAKPFAASTAKRRMEELFAIHGVCSERLDLVPLIPSTKSHLQVYSHVDVGLDPFPYAGTTTTCEALFMGVPVITMGTRPENGDHAHNVGVSLLTAIGHTEFIAYTEEDYIEKAVGLGTDLARLKAIRSSLRTDMMESPLGLGDRYMRNVEKMFCGMWTEQGGKVAEEVTPIPLSTECEKVLSGSVPWQGEESIGSTTPPCRSSCDSSDEEESVKDSSELGDNKLSKETPSINIRVTNDSSVTISNE
ncbi:unnamed protein product [Agarophyton chilense]|eukprot:gb/GEZJ01000969.1/.p1 GENE.gb/GEZJ01000969.1/~~gb/GEZJ01000969.1/.p1  ORF type:complete len:945 (-),score=139.04 gb/GEZJ01000969.1/:3178-6012(-)